MTISAPRVFKSLVLSLSFICFTAHATYEQAFPFLQTQDFTSAVPFLNAAAEKNDHRAMNAIGLMYRDGLGVVKNENLAIQWFEKGAGLGNVSAMNGLTSIYANGSATRAVDLPKAREWALKAASLNDPSAQFNFFQLAVQNELSKLDAAGRISEPKYMALAKRTMQERSLDAQAYTMLSRAAEQGHLGALSTVSSVLSDNVGQTNAQRKLDILDKLPAGRLPPQIEQINQQAKRNYQFLKSVGKTYVTVQLYRDASMHAVLGAQMKDTRIDFKCDSKDIRIAKVRVSRDMNAPQYVPVTAMLLKDAVLVKGDWQETWTVNYCGVDIEVPLEFQADGAGGAYFQTKNR